MFQAHNVVCTSCNGFRFYIQYFRDTKSSTIEPLHAVCIDCGQKTRAVGTSIKRLEDCMLKEEGLIRSAHGLKYEVALAALRLGVFKLQTEVGDPVLAHEN